MVSSRALRLAGAALGAVLVSGAVVAITASAAGVPVGPFAASPSPKASAAPGDKQAVCDDFMNHLAADLGKKSSDVQAAAQKAIGQTIDDQVKAGQLTQQQADHMKSKLAGQQLCSGAVAGLGRHAGGDHGPAPAIGEHYLADAAKALGMSATDLQAELKGGKTPKDIAATKGMDENAFRTAFIAAVKSDLDQQVAAGKLTSQQEQAMLQRLQTAPLPFWNGAAKMHPGGAMPTPAPSSSTT